MKIFGKKKNREEIMELGAEIEESIEEIEENTEEMPEARIEDSEETEEKKPGFFKRMKEKRKIKKEAYQALEPAKKKKVKRKRIIISAVAVVLVFFIISKLLGGNAAIPVMTKVVEVATVEANLSTSGTIKSEKTKTYFSDVDSKVGTIAVEPGEAVKEGQTVVSYDANEIELAAQKAQLEAQASEKGYEATIADNSKYQKQLSVANNNITQFKALIDQQEAVVRQIEDNISDEVVKERADLYDRQYQLQVNINNHQHQLAITEPTSSVYTNTQDNLYKLQADLQKVSNELSLLQDYKSEDNKEDALVKAKKDLTDMQTIYEEAKADKNTSKNSVMNKAKIEQTKANSDMTTLQAQDRYEKLEAAKEGMKAEFDGIVTSIDVVEGTPVSSAGTKLFTLESSKDVKVEISVSKYDLEQLKVGQKATITVAGKTYEGKVNKINRMASPNASGTPVVGTEIHINKPDDSVYLGVEAKVSIDTAKAENVLAVPIEAVNADKEGDFCYIVDENGLVVRKNVVIGISSDQMIEIKEGLKKGEQVIIGANNGIVEGSKVMPIPEQ